MFWLGVCEQFYEFKIDVHIVLIHFVFIQQQAKSSFSVIYTNNRLHLLSEIRVKCM